MKLVTITLMFTLYSVSFCKNKEINPASQCEDKIYLELKNRTIEELTEKEFQFLMQKERLCAAESKGENYDIRVRQSPAGWGVAVAILTSVTSFLTIIILSKNL